MDPYNKPARPAPGTLGAGVKRLCPMQAKAIEHGVLLAQILGGVTTATIRSARSKTSHGGT